MAMTNINIPEKLLQCPITYEIFCDPVLAQDGYTYERQAIERCIRNDDKSPVTREALSIEQLRPNRIVKELVDNLEKLLQKQNYQFRLNVDVKIKEGITPIFQSNGKGIYNAEWLSDGSRRPEIVLLRLNGARAKKEASFYVDLSRHPHIIRTFGFVYDKNNADQTNEVLLLQEYARKGSLFDLLLDRATAPNEKTLIQIFLQIIEAMISLAYNRIIHGDLACRNVLVFQFDENEPEKTIVKITDFGLSRNSQLFTLLPGSASTASYIIPTRYAAPEILSSNGTSTAYTEKSDVYSMGVLMWEAYSRGAMPWSNIEQNTDVNQRVINGELLPKPSNCSLSVWSIITETWSVSPADRPTFSELKHLLTEQYYHSDWMPQNQSGTYHTSANFDLTEIRTQESQRHREEQGRRMALRHREEQDRRTVQRHQEEQDRKIAQEYSLVGKRQQEERRRPATFAEEPRFTEPNYQSVYSGKPLNCKGRACAKCGGCRDWYWRPNGQYHKHYIKRGDATCCIDGGRRVNCPDQSGQFYARDGGDVGGGRVYRDGVDHFYCHSGFRPSGIYGKGRLCACDDNLS